MAFGGFDAAFGGVGGPFDFEVAGEVPDLVGVDLQPGGELETGVVAVTVPVPVLVVDDPGGHGLVEPFPQPGEQVGVQGGLAAGLGGLDRVVGLGEGLGDLAGPGLLQGAALFKLGQFF